MYGFRTYVNGDKTNHPDKFEVKGFHNSQRILDLPDQRSKGINEEKRSQETG